MKRNLYIENTQLETARKEFLEALTLHRKTETVPVRTAAGRVLAKAVYASMSSPAYNACAMDGIAVRAKETAAARPHQPVRLSAGDFVRVNTGQPLPEGFDAVIMIEDVVLENDEARILSSVATFDHVRVIGEDIVETEMIRPSGHRIRPVDVGAMLAGGVEEAEVYAQPQVAILPTGTEIVEHAADMETGRVLDSNSWMLAGLVEEAGGIARRHAPVPDDFDTLKQRVAELAEEADVLLIGAGSSAGSKDYTRAVMESLGDLVRHGIAIKPGKPTVLGRIGDTPVIGIPGYPVSAYVSFREFVEPVLLELGGRRVFRQKLSAELAADVTSSLKHAEYLRLNIGKVRDRYVATPMQTGAGVSMSLVRADGIGVIPQNVEGMRAGEWIDAVLVKSQEEIDETLVITGSHDVVLDLVSDYMPVSSTHVGSMGGILAMLSGQTLLAPIHLLDPETGTYNIPYVKKYLQEDMALIKGVLRTQGLMVPKGNPLKIKGYEDLVREDVRFVNRQPGAGTRVLLDYRLGRLRLDPADIAGYDNAVTTHMNVAQAVRAGDADTGLGAYSAALALGLDFIETDSEEYDFLVRQADLEDPRIVRLIEVLRSEDFQTQVTARGGYDTKDTGKVELL